MTSEFVQLVYDDVEEKMARAVANARSEFAKVRTGRANASLVEKLPVEAYGEMMPLQQLAGFSVPEARMLIVSPFDKENMGAIEKAIQNSDLGLNPSNDGQVLRLVFPQLTQDRRKELVRRVRNMGEDGKIAMRNVRRDGRKELDSLEKDGDLSEDDLRRATEHLDALIRKNEALIDEALAEKEQELLEV